MVIAGRGTAPSGTKSQPRSVTPPSAVNSMSCRCTMSAAQFDLGTNKSSHNGPDDSTPGIESRLPIQRVRQQSRHRQGLHASGSLQSDQGLRAKFSRSSTLSRRIRRSASPFRGIPRYLMTTVGRPRSQCTRRVAGHRVGWVPGGSICHTNSKVSVDCQAELVMNMEAPSLTLRVRCGSAMDRNRLHFLFNIDSPLSSARHPSLIQQLNSTTARHYSRPCRSRAHSGGLR